MNHDVNEPRDPVAGAAEPAMAADPAPAGEASAKPPDSSGERIAALEAQVAEFKDMALRSRAEIDNVRKRAERDKAESAKYAITRFAKDILSVADNLDRAIATAPQAAEGGDDGGLAAFLDGVRMTGRELLNVLERNGIRRLDPKGEAFNPHQHESVMELEDRTVPAGTVVQVHQAGFMIEDRVLRPAIVVVARGGPKAVKAAEPAPADGASGGAGGPEGQGG